MTKLKDWLAKTLAKLRDRHSQLARAQRRYLANRKRAYKAHAQQVVAQEAADRLRVDGNHLLAKPATKAEGEAKLRQALRKDKEGVRHATVAFKNHGRAQYQLGKVKECQQAIHKLNKSRKQIEEDEIAWRKEHGVEMTDGGHKVTGGTPRQRLRLAMHKAAHNCTAGAQNNYYSMTGALPKLIATIKGMAYGFRFDCSSFATGLYFCCNLDDPNGGDYRAGETMYTGSLGEHGEAIPESEAQTGDLVLYGDFPHHHVEVVDNPKLKTTIGHGSAPIDPGIFNLFGDGNYHVRRYL